MFNWRKESDLQHLAAVQPVVQSPPPPKDMFSQQAAIPYGGKHTEGELGSTCLLTACNDFAQARERPTVKEML